MEFFAAGATFRERLFMAANRVGKTEGAGGYEMTLHLTGRYPDWWEGRRFDKPVTAITAGDTSTTTRDIQQRKLLGNPGNLGAGLVPADCILSTRRKSGVADAIEFVKVRHVSGGESCLYIKYYDQRREAFQGTELDVIWLDEEPPADVFEECLLRTMTTDGLLMLTFTPLSGLSDVVLQFLSDGRAYNGAVSASKYVTTATWDDAPHLSAQQKQELWDSMSPHQRDARSKGIPVLGSGAIYPIPEKSFVVEPFAIPEFWPRAYGLDVGWNNTAAVWGAHDRETNTLYLYAEHLRGKAEPSVHVDAIKARGSWISGAIDPASAGSSQKDGSKLIEEYRRMGLRLDFADNAVEAGIHKVLQRLSSGRLKVFSTLPNWLGEFRLYRRDDKGKVIKERDHLMDATRYLVMSGMRAARCKSDTRATRQAFAD
jgi:phage terminase large subunit-like protein